MEYRIGLVSPYKKLTDEVIKISHKKGISLIAHTAVMERALVAAKQLESSGVTAIVLREDTCIYLKDHINLPLIPISISSIDILRIVLKSKKIARKILLANFKSHYKNIELLEEATNCQIDQMIFHTREEACNKIKKSASEYKVLIGGALTTAVAAENGIASFLIEPGQESIEQALEIACNIAQTKIQEQQKIKEITTIINQSTDGIIAIDKNKNMTVFNPKAEKIFGTDFYMIDEHKKSSILGNTFLNRILSTKIPVNEEIVKINNQDFIITTMPLLINNKIYGGVATLQEVSRVQKTEQNIRVNSHVKGLKAKFYFEDIIGTSNTIRTAIVKAKKFALSSFTILITGETGTGKELFAQSVHNYSTRRNGPFVAVNCAAIPDNLLEAELFGYEEGSFTGAKKGGKPGLFELAHNGTIFLDEIGDLPLNLQAHLLRVIQEKEVIRVGGKELVPIDVKIVACTNVDLYEKVLQGSFREDLFYRLSVLHLHLPPLRERLEDIPLIASHILKKYFEKKYNTDIIIAALDTLNNTGWKGNVRELENVLAKLSVLIENDDFNYQNVVNEIKCNYTYKNQNITTHVNETSTSDLHNLKNSTVKTEREILNNLIQQNLPYSEIAKMLGISRTTLWRKIKKHQLTKSTLN